MNRFTQFRASLPMFALE